MWQSSNPALHNESAFEAFDGSEATAAARPAVATLQGVVNKTGLFAAIAVAGGAGGYWLVGAFPSMLWISTVAAFVLAIGVGIVVGRNPALAKTVGPLYALVEGGFLGALTGTLDAILAQQGATVAGGLALQAFVITISILLAMLALYSMRIIRPSRTFVAVVSVATTGIMLTYVLSFVLSFFGVAMPFVSLASAMQGGQAAWIGLGLNVVFLGVASLWFVIDFKMIEDLVAREAPRDMEWYCGFALLVTLAWVYFEAVKLVFRIAMLVNRD